MPTDRCKRSGAYWERLTGVSPADLAPMALCVPLVETQPSEARSAARRPAESGAAGRASRERLSTRGASAPPPAARLDPIEPKSAMSDIYWTTLARLDSSFKCVTYVLS
jgi:hypothetical protein